MVRIIWKDACEGPAEQDFSQANTRVRGPTTATVTTTGRFLRVSSGCMILDDVLSEESDGVPFYEKQAQGKWLSIPLGTIEQVVPIRELAGQLLKETRRRRTILRQRRFIPRSKKLSTGETSRMLYVA